MEIIFTTGSDGRFIALCRELDRHLSTVVGGEKQKNRYDQYNTTESIHDAVLIVENGTLAACGGFRAYEPGTAEIKRVFTRGDFRNRGFGMAVVRALETRAKEKGYRKLILETNALLAGARRLYEAAGFSVIDNYGQYADMPESVCMEKRIDCVFGGAAGA